LLNEKAHLCFQKNGYLVIKDAIDIKVLDELRLLYKENFKTQVGMYVTHHNEQDEIKNKKYTHKIFSKIGTVLKDIFFDYQILLAHFAVKGNGNEGLFNMHQDWSVVQEELFGVIHCWIPLQDVSMANGTLAVVPESHIHFHNFRSGTCPIRFIPISELGYSVKHITANVGDLVLYHPALFHGSGVNNSNTERLAVVAAITHPNAERVYYHKTYNEIVMHELLDIDLFSRLDNLAKGESPVGKAIKKVPYRVLEISDDDIVNQIKTLGNVEVC
jgi:ectoine hydroxylase-related dioxygenase (phytanoyl-CoA dioxygenase family)